MSPSGRNSQAKNRVNKEDVIAHAAFHEREHGRGQLFGGSNRCDWAGFRTEGALDIDAVYMRCCDLFGKRITAWPGTDDWARDSWEIY